MNNTILERILGSSSSSICGECNINIDSRAMRIRCIQCSGIELCYGCYEKGVHSSHNLMGIWISPNQDERAKNRQEGDKDAVHNNIYCDECKGRPITGDRFKCRICDNYDLCRFCHSRGCHNFHTFQRISKSSIGKEHPGIICDACYISPIRGIRFKCTVCHNVDFCGPCRSAGVHSDHVMASIVKPTRAEVVSQLQRSGQTVHRQIMCDNCGLFPITGSAFHCTQCRDYDLCSGCETVGFHSHHTLLAKSTDTMVSTSEEAQSQPRQAEVRHEQYQPPASTGTATAAAESQTDERLICGICMQNEKKVAFQCGHSVCSACSSQLDKCPFCQCQIINRINLFL